MFWCDHLADRITGPQIVNDSKTPSGRVHVGALRGVLIHDAMVRTLERRAIPVRYLFGVDDYDPLDELPAENPEFFEAYLGTPLCNVPAPCGSNASDMADFYIREFFQIFDELGVLAEKYRMRDVYRSGQFNAVIDRILRNAPTVRRIYKNVSNSERPENWYPFQVICEKCGRIGTTETTFYDGKEVAYFCRSDLVKWARGCGYQGKVSPFDGRGKLPWKLEWPAKWHTFGVTLEGAGKDHCTKGGSREVAAHCLKEIFGGRPPLNVPYEFFLVRGAKMSSSRGIGASARSIANLLPPEVLRFLMIRTKPNSIVNFSPDEDFIVKLFNDFDAYHWKVFHDAHVTEHERRIYYLSQLEQGGDYYVANFHLILTLLQMPHVNILNEIEKRKGSALNASEIKHLDSRISAARYWLEHYATEDQKLHLHLNLPSRARELTAVQRAFLHRLADALPLTSFEETTLQSKLFEVARLTPISQPQAFQAIYRILLDRDSGPKAGNLLAVLDPAFLICRFKALPYDKPAFLLQTGKRPSDFSEWLDHSQSIIRTISLKRIPSPYDLTTDLPEQIDTIDFEVTTTDGKVHTQRIIYNADRLVDMNRETERGRVKVDHDEYLNALKVKYPSFGWVELEAESGMTP